ncbi:MAG TPA: hypothetical protein VK934_07935 [Fimbriimonas sp.]|nr:hypothetical protein [Fimbriimonas sp.]
MLACLLVAPVAPLRILFLGNSHTAVNNVPAMVQQLLGGEKKVATELRTGAYLEDLASDGTIAARVKDFDVLVLQAAKISSSHKYVYSQVKGTALAKAAVRAGVRTFLFAEWPRRGWDETEFILNVYRGIAKGSGATIVPAGKAWDRALKMDPTLTLWASDGNHADLAGSYLAACTLAMWISHGTTRLDWKPTRLESGAAKQVRQSVFATWKK